jgi:hypothetical protein
MAVNRLAQDKNVLLTVAQEDRAGMAHALFENSGLGPEGAAFSRSIEAV